jgi:phenylpropionate dioxygenase-like ring-hydroxylating dioxygenase large terminal subunit
MGSDALSIDAYIDYGFHRREVEKVWRRTWQVACREEVVREVGSYAVYDIVDDSAIIMRGADGRLRAFVNSCLHRGTRLCDGHGRQQQIRCPFHGFSWHLNGELKTLPCAWDFPRIDATAFNLPELRVDCWGGFVFVNFAAEGPALAEYLGDLPSHFERWPLDQRYTAAHVTKRIGSNWKVVIEAFLETFHVSGLHPQSLPFLGDVNAQYDLWPDQPHYSRMVSVSGVASPLLGKQVPQQRVLDAAAEFGLCTPRQLESGETARAHIVECIRAMTEQRLGVDISSYSDAEVVDVIQYYLFPNLIAFGGLGAPLAYCMRPDGDDPHHSIFEVWLLLPYPEGTAPPEPAPLRALGEDEHFGDVAELSYFGPVLDQDAVAMPLVQRGLRSSSRGKVVLANYQESRIRHMRETLDRYLSE